MDTQPADWPTALPGPWSARAIGWCRGGGPGCSGGRGASSHVGAGSAAGADPIGWKPYGGYPSDLQGERHRDEPERKKEREDGRISPAVTKFRKTFRWWQQDDRYELVVTFDTFFIAVHHQEHPPLTIKHGLTAWTKPDFICLKFNLWPPAEPAAN